MNKALNFLNLLDSEGRLSITNLAVIITLIKLAVSPSASITEAGMLLISLGNYAHKRVITNANQTPEQSPLQTELDDTKAKLAEIQTNVNGLLVKAGFKL